MDMHGEFLVGPETFLEPSTEQIPAEKVLFGGPGRAAASHLLAAPLLQQRGSSLGAPSVPFVVEVHREPCGGAAAGGANPEPSGARPPRLSHAPPVLVRRSFGAWEGLGVSLKSGRL